MKIKKMYQGNVPENKILNTESNSQTDTYSCDYLNKLNTYSTTEQRIGTWINGKPIYRKVIDLGSGDISRATFSLGLTTIRTIIRTECNILVSDGLWRNLPFCYTSTNDAEGKPTWMGGFNIRTSNGTLYMEAGTTIGSIYEGYFVIEYTKTTD